MNDFTKEELESIVQAFQYIEEDPAWRELTGWDDELKNKIQSMIDNYCDDPWKTRKIAESHLREAESLISHAMCLLDMKEEE